MSLPSATDRDAVVQWASHYRDFIRFCEDHVYVEDKQSHQAVKFKLWPGQRKVAEQLVRGEWLAVLKARRLGLTWLLVAYAAWLLTFRGNRQVVVLNQDKEYAQDFLERVRFVQERLPTELQVPRSVDNQSRMNVRGKSMEGVRQESWIRSLACTKRAIRSLAADLVIFDEAAYMPLLKQARQAAQPAVETGKGQIVLISTSNGPSGDFYEVWTNAYQRTRAAAGENGSGTRDLKSNGTGKMPVLRTPPRYKPVFLHWRENPHRTEDWYNAEKLENESDPLYMKREYPETPEQAFESANGRVYPKFSPYPPDGDKFIREIERQPDWNHYRAIDFGGVDPFVCLWGCVIPHEGPGLTIDPSCTNLIRELLAYSYDDKGRPCDEDNHTCDALRYMVGTAGNGGIHGHLHIYRELYVANSVDRGLSLPDLARRICSASGQEHYELTVADRSRPDSIVLLTQMNIPTKAHRNAGGHYEEIADGISRVTNLIVGTHRGSEAAAVPEFAYAGLPRGLAQRGVFA